MRVSRRFTTESSSPYESLNFVSRRSEIRNPDGALVFELDNVRIPESWSQVATDILAQKYFRRAGVPQTNSNGSSKLDLNGEPVLGGENDSPECEILRLMYLVARHCINNFMKIIPLLVLTLF